MKGEILEGILLPKSKKDWFLLVTNKGKYELRLGGVNKINSIKYFRYKKFDYKGLKSVIRGGWTDKETLFILLSNLELLEHGWSYINSKGEKSFELRIIDKNEYENDYKTMLEEECIKLF